MKRIAATLVLVAVLATPAAATQTDRFSSSDLSEYIAGGAPGWFIQDGRLAHTYTSHTGFVELVRRADAPQAQADVTLSNGRSNAGLTVLWKDHRNNLWAKLEITPGNPDGRITIGRRRRGDVKSCLACAGVNLQRGQTYHVDLKVEKNVATFKVTGASVTFSKTISYRLSSRDLDAFGSGRYAGVRAKYLYDEDDGGSRWDDLTV
jgi:hypothetical protein